MHPAAAFLVMDEAAPLKDLGCKAIVRRMASP